MRFHYFSRWRMFEFYGALIFQNPIYDLYWSSIETTDCLVFWYAFWRQTDKQTNKQTNE